MKKILLFIFMFLLSVNIFAKENVEKQVKKIREEFVKINSEKNYKLDAYEEPENGRRTEYYRKDLVLKKVVDYIDMPIEDIVSEYYLKDDKVFFTYIIAKTYTMKEDGTIDTKKTSKIEKRYYFDDEGNLIRYIKNGKIYDKGNIPQMYIREGEEIQGYDL